MPAISRHAYASPVSLRSPLNEKLRGNLPDELGAGEDFFDAVQVLSDLLLELLGGGEFLLAANALDKFQLDAMPVDVAVEIEEMRLDRAHTFVEGRPHSDVGDRGIVTVVEHHPCRVNAIGRETFGVALEVGGGKTDSATALAPMYHRAVQEVVAPSSFAATRTSPLEINSRILV